MSADGMRINGEARVRAQQTYYETASRYAASTKRVISKIVGKPVTLVKGCLGYEAQPQEAIHPAYTRTASGMEKESTLKKSMVVIANVVMAVASVAIVAFGMKFLIASAATGTFLSSFGGVSMLVFGTYSSCVTINKTESSLKKLFSSEKLDEVGVLYKKLQKLSEQEIKKDFQELCHKSFEEVFDTEEKRAQLKTLTGAKSEVHGVAKALALVKSATKFYRLQRDKVELMEAEIETHEYESSIDLAYEKYNKQVDVYLRAKIRAVLCFVPLIKPDIKEKDLLDCYQFAAAYPVETYKDMREDNSGCYVMKKDPKLEVNKETTRLEFEESYDYLTPLEIDRRSIRHISETFLEWIG